MATNNTHSPIQPTPCQTINFKLLVISLLKIMEIEVQRETLVFVRSQFGIGGQTSRLDATYEQVRN